MGKIAQRIIEAIKEARPETKQDGGLKISDEVFELWEHELDARHSMHAWYGSPRIVELIGVPILDENGEQRRWPKAHGPYPCPECSGTGHEKHGLDGSRIPGVGDCLACDGTGLKADLVEETGGGETGTETQVAQEISPAEAPSPRALLEKQGVRICQTWNRKALSIDEMLDSFPFGKVLLALDATGWTWRGETPTFVQLRDKAGELLRDLEGGLDSATTGGLEASRWGDEYTLRFPSLSGEEKGLTGEGASA